MATVEAEIRSVRPAWRAAIAEALGPSCPAAIAFPEAADHEERVVDSQAQPQHGGQILNQNGQVPVPAQESCNRHSGRDGELPDGQWNQGRHEASESQKQKREGCGNHQIFAVPDVIGAGFPNVEIQAESRRSVRASPPDNGRAIVSEERSRAREAWGQAIRRVRRSTRVL